jgi:hypothetical protein
VVLHPGHISGPWPVITPAGNLDLDVWRRLASGEPLPLPDLGLGVLHHVHADDVAQAFERALTRPAAIGSSFHVVSEQAMTLRGLAAGVAGWFGREPVIDLVDWSEFERRVGTEHAGVSREHVARSIAASVDRARDVLGTGRGTAHSTPSTSRFAGSRRTATSTWATRTSDRAEVAQPHGFGQRSSAPMIFSRRVSPPRENSRISWALAPSASQSVPSRSDGVRDSATAGSSAPSVARIGVKVDRERIPMRVLPVAVERLRIV